MPACVVPAAGRAETPRAASLALWNEYKSRYLTADGRIVDTSNGGISHSEGQGYAMLLAAGFNGREAFDSIWRWTRTSLSRRDNGLFVWRWSPSGASDDAGTSATDGDLLIAWALLRAARQWSVPALQAEAVQLVWSLRLHALRSIGPWVTLSPGSARFDRPTSRIVNLSYWVFPAIQDLRRVDDDPIWTRLADDGLRLLRSARFGLWELPPDWLEIQADGRLDLAAGYPAHFSYDAIRIPLYLVWAGLEEEALLRPFRALRAVTGDSPRVATRVDLETDTVLSRDTAKAFLSIHFVLDCVVRRQTLPARLRGFDQWDDYFSATILLLVHLLLRERYPACLE